MKTKKKKQKLPRLGLLYLDYVMRFFDKSNFRGWPNKIETVVYHWKNDKERFIKEVKRKKIDVLIGNIPATAYETFREIARALPNVRFVPSLDAQFSNKSKENVTRFCWKYDIPVPKTNIFYDHKKADEFLKNASYPRIIKRSYGPSNYGGYFVHKADSYEEAKELLRKKKYHPVYTQDFVPMEADVRVMLIGHKPVCAFFRRAPEGEWLTNTSQGGSMDYHNVPVELLEVAVKASKAANAEYFAADIAVGKDGEYRLLECATAFAAFPYIRDWIGSYIMWKFGNGRFKKPYFPMYNWEELGKIDSSLLRTMRYISFGRYVPSGDGEFYTDKEIAVAGRELKVRELDEKFPMLLTKETDKEEWPSEIWNYQDRYRLQNQKRATETPVEKGDDEASDNIASKISEQSLMEMFINEVKGIGRKKANNLMQHFGKEKLIAILEKEPELLLEFKGIKDKTLKKISKAWYKFKQIHLGDI